MKTHFPLKRIVAATLGAALLSAGANALADPPSRIARLAFISGPVSLAPAGETNWEYAALNRPLIAGDRLWVEPGARDELQVGGAALRMDGNTLVTLLNLDDRITQLQLSQGRLNVRVRRLRPNEVLEIDTPNLALVIRQPGDYRIEVDPAGNGTMVAVPRGLAEAYGDGNAYRLATGQAYSFGGTDLRDVRYARPNLGDDFDRWSASRDRRIEQARSVRYVSPDLIGYEDLDDQGSWRVVPNYGNVWMPAHVARDWAPYRDGHWSYVQPWGWTWVDDAPWGFAVSHYGRWARFNDGWGWVPGPRAASPIYAPALVAFISIGSGAYAQRERPVAWFPLAPREVYRPSYRASPTYITNINITNTTIVDRRQIARADTRFNYANRQVGGAVTAVPSSAFVRSQPVSRAAVALPMAALAGAAIAHTAPVAPERDGNRGRGSQGHQPPQAMMQRQVLARTAPPAQFRQAPRPAANTAAPAQQLAGPAPRMLPQDRHGGGRQLRDVPVQQAPAAGPSVAPELRGAQATQAARNGAPQAMPQQQQQGGRFGAAGDQRMNRGQRDAAPMPGQAGVPPVANVPAAGMPQREHGRDRMQAPPLAHAPTPAPAAAMRDQQAAAAQQQEQQRHQQQAAAEQRRNQQQAEAQQHLRQQQGAAEQQRNQQQAEVQQRQRQQQGAAEQQRNQQQAESQQRQRQQHEAGQQRDRQQQAEAQQRQMQQQAAAQQRDQQAESQQRQRQQHEAGQQRDRQQQAAAQQRDQQQQAEGQQRQKQQAEAQQRQVQQQAAEQQRAQQRDQQHAAAEQQRAQQQAAAAQQRAQQQQAAEQQRAQQQAAQQQQRAQQQAAAEQRHAERPQRHEVPAPQPAPAAAQPAAQPAPAAQHGEGKKEEKEKRRRGEQN